MSLAAQTAARSALAVSIRSGTSQNHAQLAIHRETPALGVHEVVQDRRPGPVRCAAEHVGDERLARSRADDHVDVRVPGCPRIGRSRQRRGEISRRRVDAACQPVEGGPQRGLPRPVGDAGAVGHPARDAVVAAPRGPLLQHGRRESACLRHARSRRPATASRTADRLEPFRRPAGPGTARGTADGGRTARRRSR